ncbi:hypothetical protein [Pedobacter sp.]|uniref:hypothetical protein n=1 Tax=Pedobacter sp. TaxID=1411316 RepID=UPI003D7FB13B
MPNQDHNRNQSNQYDKIIKENLEVTLPVIIKDMLGLEIQSSEELPDDVQHTKERKPDALKKVTDRAGNTFVLQVEFQVEDEREMVYRMAEYYIMLMRRYKLPIKQFVVFLKDVHPVMPTFLTTDHFNYDFKLIRIAEANYKLFLKSDNPEVKMLGILANFNEEDSYNVVKSIIESIQFATKGDFAESRYFKQLRILLQLRNSVEQQFEKAMETVTKFFKEENDFLYRKGEEKGREEGREEGIEEKSLKVVENLILELGSSDEQAARIADVTVDFVQKIRAELNGDKAKNQE